MNKLISFDLKADFGMLKKPDTNESVYLTFNLLHKPALLEILGAIAGKGGFGKNVITLKLVLTLKKQSKVFFCNLPVHGISIPSEIRGKNSNNIKRFYGYNQS